MKNYPQGWPISLHLHTKIHVFLHTFVLFFHLFRRNMKHKPNVRRAYLEYAVNSIFYARPSFSCLGKEKMFCSHAAIHHAQHESVITEKGVMSLIV